MKFFAIPCIMLAGLIAGPTIAKQTDTDIEVSAPSSVEAWRDNLARNLDNNLDREMRQSVMTGSMPTGLASVRFTCSETGEAQNIELTRRSGNRRLNAMAKEVVADLKTLHPLPAGVGADQVFVANIAVEIDDRALDRDLAILRDEQRTRMAARGPRPIALNVSANAR